MKQIRNDGNDMFTYNRLYRKPACEPNAVFAHVKDDHVILLVSR